MMRTAHGLVLLNVCVLLGVFLYMRSTYPHLPEHVTTKFDLQGQALRQSPKSVFLLSFTLLIAMNILLMAGVPLLVRKAPSKWVNIPWKQFWFADDSRRRSVYDKILILMAIIALVENIFFSLFYHQTVASVFKPHELARQGRFVTLSLVFLAITFLVGLPLYLYFGFRPPAAYDEEGI